jgi:putative ABC transport system permease protein
MFRIASAMLAYRRVRFLVTTLGIGALFWLSIAQVGLLVGWCNTIAALINEGRADLWVMAEHTPAYDYGTAIPRHRVRQVRNVAGVTWAEGLCVGWSVWQCPNGRRINVALVGLDPACAGGPWQMSRGMAEDVHLPNSVFVDELFARDFGVAGIGDEVELMGRRAVVRGFTRGVRSFTALPYVFTSAGNFSRYCPTYNRGAITYVLARIRPDADPEQVARAVSDQVAAVETLTTTGMVRRSVTYWMLGTGIGLTIILTALLGTAVGALVTSQTLYTITQEHQGHYATLLAIGFSRWQLIGCVLYQSAALSARGIVVGGLAFALLMALSARTSVPVETNPSVFVGVVLLFVAGCLSGATLAVRAVLRIDPLTAFRSAA